MKMEIIATFSIHLYMSIYSTSGFWISPLSNALCRLFQHSGWGDRCSQSHQLHRVAQSLSWWVSVLGGTDANVERTLMCNCVKSMSDDWSFVYRWSVSDYTRLDQPSPRLILRSRFIFFLWPHRTIYKICRTGSLFSLCLFFFFVLRLQHCMSIGDMQSMTQ